jgi:hypothetical protein
MVSSSYVRTSVFTELCSSTRRYPWGVVAQWHCLGAEAKLKLS